MSFGIQTLKGISPYGGLRETLCNSFFKCKPIPISAYAGILLHTNNLAQANERFIDGSVLLHMGMVSNKLIPEIDFFGGWKGDLGVISSIALGQYFFSDRYDTRSRSDFLLDFARIRYVMNNGLEDDDILEKHYSLLTFPESSLKFYDLMLEYSGQEAVGSSKAYRKLGEYERVNLSMRKKVALISFNAYDDNPCVENGLYDDHVTIHDKTRKQIKEIARANERLSIAFAPPGSPWSWAHTCKTLNDCGYDIYLYIGDINPKKALEDGTAKSLRQYQRRLLSLVLPFNFEVNVSAVSNSDRQTMAEPGTISISHSFSGILDEIISASSTDRG